MHGLASTRRLGPLERLSRSWTARLQVMRARSWPLRPCASGHFSSIGAPCIPSQARPSVSRPRLLLTAAGGAVRAPRSLGSFYQNVVWIQFSTIVSQTVAFYSVSTDDVNFLVVLGGIFYVPCSFAVTPLIE